jgi:hypothetical protein
VLIVVAVFALATATLTFAARKQATHTAVVPAPKAKRTVTQVPDVRNQVYVFAKGVLEDAGFAWRVGSGAPGYAGYRVDSQVPAAGTRVFQVGAPTIVLHLTRDAHYDIANHSPESASPYPGDRVELVSAVSNTVSVPAVKPVAKPKTAAKPVAKPAAKSKAVPKEPLDEMTLPARAQLLAAWVATHRDASSANVQHWLYQHSWIVAGAKFGWWHGAEALKTLLAVDRTVERQWSMGAKSEADAQTALDFVQSQH